MKKILILAVCLLLNPYNDYSQPINTITTAVPFLMINPNAQSTAIGDIGVVAAADYYESGLIQNPALLSRNEKVTGLKVSYKPWLRQIVTGINMIDLGCYYAVNKKISLGYSYNLFSLGTITYTNTPDLQSYKPKEFYHNLRYAQSLSPDLSLGAGLKYIVSDLTNNKPINGNPTHKGKALAADLGLDYRKEIAKKEHSFWRYDIGVSISNIGNKMRYTDSVADFLPMQLAVGTLWTYTKNVNSSLRYCLDLAYQGERLLVPTPPQYTIDANGNSVIAKGKDPNVSVIQGASQSFYDAPDGIREEISENIHKIGIENRFVFQNELSFALRAGLLNESKYKGNRRNINAGLGFRYKFLYADFGMILFYRETNLYDGSYSFGIRRLHSFTINLGFKYTFKKRDDSNKTN